MKDKELTLRPTHIWKNFFSFFPLSDSFLRLEPALTFAPDDFEALTRYR